MNTLLASGREGRPISGIEMIDMHGHFGRIGHAVPDLSPAGIVDVLDRLGVRSIICSHMCCMSHEARHGNRELLSAMQAYPGRILGYISLWPWSAEEVRAEVEWGLQAGFSGIKMHNVNGFPYTDDALVPAYQLAEEHRLPILFHTWGAAAEFAEMRELARQYPNTPLLLAHAGTGDLSLYLNLARDHANIYLELAFSLSPRGLVEQLVREVGAEKIVWGSDAYFFNQAQQIGKVLGAKIDDEAKTKILSGNALRILNNAF